MTDERVVLVMGGTSGIGLATARLLAERGDRVVIAARDERRLEAVAAELPGAVGVAPLDVTVADDVDRAVARVVADHGRLDAVVMSAQVMAYGTVEQVPEHVFRRVVDTAVLGVYHVARAALPVFRRQGGGRLVVVNSLLAEIAVPSLSAYCTAKWGQLGMVRSLTAEVRREPGVHVCLVLPGAVDTPIYEQAATFASRRGSAPAPVVTPEKVARACVRAVTDRRPRRKSHVGPVNPLAVAGFRFLPFVYDRLAPLLVKYVVLRGPAVTGTEGNVMSPRPEREAERGGWSYWGRRRRR